VFSEGLSYEAEKSKVLSRDLKTTQLMIRTLCGSELQTEGAENHKAHLV